MFFSCATVPTATYNDKTANTEIKNYNRKAKPGDIPNFIPPGKWNIGIIYNKNTNSTFDYLEKTREYYAKYGVYSAVQDIDTDKLKDNISECLANVFKKITYVSSINDTPDLFDYFVYLDIKATCGAISGNKTKLSIELIFVDKSNNYLGSIVQEASEAVPYPATDVGFKSVITKITSFMNISLWYFITDIQMKLTS